MEKKVKVVSPDSWMRYSKYKIDEMPDIPVLLFYYFFRNLMRPVESELKQHCNPNSNSDSVIDYNEHAFVGLVFIDVDKRN